MADTRMQDDDQALHSQQVIADQSVETPEGEEQVKLNLEVKIDKISACERHITVSVSREDIDRYFNKEYEELAPTAQVPGFRPGHAPRKLIENRFKKEVGERVKGMLLMDSLAQIHEDQSLSAISEPDLDLAAVEIPATGPLMFEFKLEVRPEFEMPKWKGLKIDKPVREFSAADIDGALKRLLANRGRLVPHDGPAEAGDYLTTNLTFKSEGEVVSNADEEVIRLRPVLSFRDGRIEDFEKQMLGVRGGETRTLDTQLTDDAPNAALRGKKIQAEFAVLEVKRLEIPELDAELLESMGGFKLEADLRDAIKDSLTRRLAYQQRQRARQQITAALTVAADWELPPHLLERQANRELARAVMELQSSGFGDDEIQAHENLLRQNSMASTAKALKEHFILERIAEEQSFDAEDNEYDNEIELIAAQTNESARRVRARYEKGGMMDVLRNQIVERKVIDLILQNAEFHEVPYELEESDVEAIDLTAGGHDQSEIPEAKPGGVEPAEGHRPGETRAHV